jgi:dTDP-4-dehydrorhamnose reductase
MLAAERAVTACERHKIIRLSWIIGWRGENLMTKIASAAAQGGDAAIIAERRGAPVSHADIARMLNAVIRQLAFGAENWGVFHYGAANVCTEEAFAQEVLKWLAALDMSTGAVVDVSDSDYEPTSAAVGYKRLLDNYGIQPRKWKQMLKAELEAWSQQRELVCD